MNEFLTLIAQLFFVTCLQSILEMFIDSNSKPYLLKILNIACYAGALYLLLQFIFDNLLPEIFNILELAF